MNTAVNDSVELSIRHFVDAWRLMCTGAPAYTEEAAHGVHCVFSGIPVAFFNVALVTDASVSAETLTAAGQRACDWASKRAAPWLFVVTHETLVAGTDAAAALDACGMVPLMPLTGMIAQHVAPPSNVPTELQLVRPDDDDRCSAIVDVNGLAYGMDLESSKEILGTRAFWSGHFPALGLADGAPACAAAVMMVDGYRYVALVATDPARQRRGYGELVMRHALALSALAHGDGPTTLHATEAGRPIYARMGYVPIAAHTVFIEKKFLSGH
jgi:ribosomal protein S18 acetylase RimI-like enzyme